MKKTAATLIMALLVIAAAGFLLVKAETRTIIVPDDYPSIQVAIDNAPNGYKIMVKRGIYEEQVLSINKSLSLIGENTDTTKIILHPPSHPLFGSNFMVYDSPIQIRADNVVLSGFTIAADGGSISAEGTILQIIGDYFKNDLSVKGNKTQILDNKFDSSVTLEGSNNSISKNALNSGSIACKGPFNTILENRISQKQLSNETGILLSGSLNLIFNNSLTNCSINLEGDSNYNIIGKNICSSLLISRSYNNTVFGNYITGILGFVGSHNTLYRNYIQGILLGNQYMDTPNNTFYENNFDFSDGRKILVYTGVTSSLTFDNGTVGNYWSDYLIQYPHATGNISGIGNTPYVVYLAQGNSVSPFTYGFSDKSSYELTLTDHYPLISPSNISAAQFQLPAWTNITATEPNGADTNGDGTSEPEPSSFPVAPVAVAVSVVAVVAAGLILTRRKRYKEVA